MAAMWTSVIADAWNVVSSITQDFLPVLGVAVALAIFEAIWAVFSNRGS